MIWNKSMYDNKKASSQITKKTAEILQNIQRKRSKEGSRIFGNETTLTNGVGVDVKGRSSSGMQIFLFRAA